jgi:hypothetical protein
VIPSRATGARTRARSGYPATNPDGSTLNAPSARPVEDVFLAAAASANGKVYLGAYRWTTVSP